MAVDIKVGIMETVASGNLKQVSKKKRGCYFNYESDLEYFPSNYTYNLCLINCRIKRAQKFCGCIPFFYTNVPKSRIPVCGPQGLVCLSTSDWYQTEDCVCPQLCANLKYYEVSRNTMALVRAVATSVRRHSLT